MQESHLMRREIMVYMCLKANAVWKINLYSRLTGVVEIKPGMNVAFKFFPLILKVSFQKLQGI